jgi:DNA repair exonuclease SbcCD nuclease subunit
MLVAIGDLHLSDSREWSFDVSERVVDYIIKWNMNNPTHSAIFLGDFTEDTLLTGRLFSLLLKLFTSLKFKKTYVVVGNHDLKKDKNNNLYLAFEFLRHPLFQDKIEIVEEYRQGVIEGLNVVILPWIHPDGTHSVKDYENPQNYPSALVPGGRDIVFAHFQDTTSEKQGDKVNIDWIKTKFYCIGHIHKPGLRYIGSVIPNKWDERNEVRTVRFYAREDGKATETTYPIPVFTDYYSIKFPEPLPQVPAQVPVWTIFNCKDEATARQQYGDIYIRKALYDIAMDNEALADLNRSMVTKDKISIDKMFNSWLDEAKLEPEIKALAKEYFTVGSGN